MLANFLQSCCVLSGSMLGLGHEGRGGGAVCGHGGVCDSAVSVPGLELRWWGRRWYGDLRLSGDIPCQAQPMVMEE